MRRIVLLSTIVLLASLGADGTPAGFCGQGMEAPGIVEGVMDGGVVSDGGGVADAGGTPDLSKGGGGGGGSGKVPHLINIVTGEDLGILIDYGTLTVFSETANVLIKLGTQAAVFGVGQRLVDIYFSKADCKGQSYIIQTSIVPNSLPQIANIAFVLSPQLTYLLQVGNPLPALHAFSRLTPTDPMNPDGMVDCKNVDMVFTNQLVSFVDTHTKLRPQDNQLKVELR